MGPGHCHNFCIGIDPADIDFMGHVNNATYLKWVQAAVISHWEFIAPPEVVATHLWIAVKHEITYRKPAFLHDQLIASAVLERVQRESAFYQTMIRRGDEILAEVNSRWCCVDSISFRPVRVANEIVRLFFDTSSESEPRNLVRQ
jgi:acyl-CoA thioester hydrolase